MINLYSFIGLYWDVLRTMISLDSILSALIYEVFDHHELCALLVLRTSSAWMHPNRISPPAMHSLGLNNTSHLFMPGPFRVKGSAPRRALFGLIAAPSVVQVPLIRLCLD